MATKKWNIPKQELESLARCFLPDIQEFYQDDTDKTFEKKWIIQQNAKDTLSAKED